MGCLIGATLPLHSDQRAEGWWPFHLDCLRGNGVTVFNGCDQHPGYTAEGKHASLCLLFTVMIDESQKLGDFFSLHYTTLHYADKIMLIVWEFSLHHKYLVSYIMKDGRLKRNHHFFEFILHTYYQLKNGLLYYAGLSVWHFLHKSQTLSRLKFSPARIVSVPPPPPNPLISTPFSSLYISMCVQARCRCYIPSETKAPSDWAVTYAVWP